jgi:MFS family permease
MRVRLPAVMRDQALRPVLLLAGTAGVAFGLTIPFLTLIARDRGISLRVIGVMAASYLIVQMLLQLPFGALSDRIGRATPIAVGFLFEAVATAGFTLADAAATFILLRVVQGVSLALIMPALRALIADITPAERRGQAYAWLFAAFSGGLLLGPPIGGLLALPLGRSPLFLIAAAVNVAMAVWTLLFLHAPRPAGAGAQAERVPYAALLTRPLIGAFLIGFASRIPEGMFTGIWSIYLDDLGASDMVIGLTFSTFAVSSLALTPVGGRLADRRPRWPKILFGNLVLGVLTFSYGLFPSIPIILLLGLLEGAVFTIAFPALDAYLATIADPRIQGRVQGAFATIGTMGAATSALFGTTLYELGRAVPFAVAGAALIALNLLAFPLVRRAEHDAEVASRRRVLEAVASD